MDNLSVYNKVRSVPAAALKQINGGRLSGMTDINPMWRIKIMTDTFGLCGIGWKYTITKQWTETFGNEVKAYCNVDLQIKVDSIWSDPIPGTGGASEVAMERNGAYVSDECYKMALTDALSVAMKALGVGADIYFSKDVDYGTKYSAGQEHQQAAAQPAQAQAPQQQPSYQVPPKTLADRSLALSQAREDLARCATKQDLQYVAQTYSFLLTDKQFVSECTAKRKQLGL